MEESSEPDEEQVLDYTVCLRHYYNNFYEVILNFMNTDVREHLNRDLFFRRK